MTTLAPASPQRTPRAPLGARRTVTPALPASPASPAPAARPHAPAPSSPDDFLARHAVEFAHLHIAGCEPAEAVSARLRAQACALEEARRVGRERKRQSMTLGAALPASVSHDMLRADSGSGPGAAAGPRVRPLSLVGKSPSMRQLDAPRSDAAPSPAADMRRTNSGGGARVRPLSLVGKSASLHRLEQRAGPAETSERVSAGRARPLSIIGKSQSARGLGLGLGAELDGHDAVDAYLALDTDAAADSRGSEEVLASRPNTMSSIATAELDGDVSRSSVRFSSPARASHRPSHSVHGPAPSSASSPARHSHRSAFSTYSWATDFSGSPAELRQAARYALPADPAPPLTSPERRDARRRQVRAMAQTVRVLEGASSREAPPLEAEMRARILRGYRAHYAGDDGDEAIEEVLLPPAHVDDGMAASPALSDVRTPDTPGVATFASMQAARDSLASHASSSASSASSDLVAQGARLMADKAWLRRESTQSAQTRGSGPSWAPRPAGRPPWLDEGATPPFEYDDALAVSAWWRADADGGLHAFADADADSCKVAGTPRRSDLGARAGPAPSSPGVPGTPGALAALAGLGLGFGRGEDGAAAPSQTTGSRRSRDGGGALPNPDPREASTQVEPQNAAPALSLDTSGPPPTTRPDQRQGDPASTTALPSAAAAVQLATSPQTPRGAHPASPLTHTAHPSSTGAAQASPPLAPCTSVPSQDPSATARPASPRPPHRHADSPAPAPAARPQASASPSSRRSPRASSSSPSPAPRTASTRLPSPPGLPVFSACSATFSAPSTPGRPSGAGPALAAASLPRASAPPEADEQPWADGPTPASPPTPPTTSPTLSPRRSAYDRCCSPGSSLGATDADADLDLGVELAGLHLPLPSAASPSLHSRPSLVPLDKLRPVPPKSGAHSPFAGTAQATLPGLAAGVRTTLVPLSPATMFALGFACPLLWAVGAWPRRHEQWAWRHADPWVTRCRYAAAVAYALVIPGLVVGVVVVATH